MTQTLVELHSSTAPQDALANAAQLLQDALAKDFVGADCNWAAGMVRALRLLECELGRYDPVGHTVDGPLADLDRIRPTLCRQWSILYLHYRDLGKRAQRLRAEVQHAAAAFELVGEAPAATVHPAKGTPVATEVPVFGAVRQQAQELLIDLNQSRDAEIALFFESVVTDIGVGD
jgi:hypothetical protein